MKYYNTFSVEEQTAPVVSVFLIPENRNRYKGNYPKLLSDTTYEIAREQRRIKPKNLVLVGSPEQLCINGGNVFPPLVLKWKYKGKKYCLTQKSPVLLDGASTPVRVGYIARFGHHVNRAFYVHDLLYGLFQNVSQKDADRIFACFLKHDGTRVLGRGIMHFALSLFGKKARKIAPENHWNYNLVELTIDGRPVLN